MQTQYELSGMRVECAVVARMLDLAFQSEWISRITHYPEIAIAEIHEYRQVIGVPANCSHNAVIPQVRGYSVIVHYMENGIQETLHLHRIQILSGLRKMHDDYPTFYAQMLCGNLDKKLGNAFLQICLFSEIKFKEGVLEASWVPAEHVQRFLVAETKTTTQLNSKTFEMGETVYRRRDGFPITLRDHLAVSRCASAQSWRVIGEVGDLSLLVKWTRDSSG